MDKFSSYFELFAAINIVYIFKYVDLINIFKTIFNTDLTRINQLENAIDNSIKANSTKIILRLLETTSHCIFEVVDNGSESSPRDSNSIESSSVIPHGIGKEIMMQNMERIGGKAEWARRLDNSGMILRLYFPKQ